MAIFTDDHVILGDETKIHRLIKEYDEAHPRATLDGVPVKITQKKYKRMKRYTPLEWILYMNGNPLKEMSRGKRNLVARMRNKARRNIP